MHEQVQTLIDAGKMDAEVGEKISTLEPGVFCLHKSWGPGVVSEWDLFGDKLIIDFEEKPGHAMKLQFAANSLKVLDGDHIFAKWVGDKESTQQLAIDDPVGFAKAVLSSFGGSMLLDSWEKIVKGRIVPEAKYRSWWESSKKQIRSDRRFVLPSKRNLPFELRDESVSPVEALLGDFEVAKDIKAKIAVLESIRKDLGVFDEPMVELEGILKAASSTVTVVLRRTPGVAIELLLARDDLVADIDGLDQAEGLQLADVVRDNAERLPEIVKGMGVGRQRQVYAAMEGIFGDTWVEQLLSRLEGSGARAISEITKFLSENGKGEQLSSHLANGLGRRGLGAEVLAWICKEREGLAADTFVRKGVTGAIIGALERDHLDETTPKTNRLHDLLMDDKALIPALLGDADTTEIRHFTRRIQATPVFEGLNKNSLLARIVKSFPQVEDLISGDQAEGADETPSGLIVSWKSLKERQEKLDNIINKQIPENIKEISVAREHGDLRENFEFKAAKQQQAVLARLRAELEDEISRAQGTDFSEADTKSVSAGTIIDFEDVATGAAETVTVLGAWDTDPDKQIISYLTGMGKELIGRVPGDEVELPTENEGETRTIRITGIRAFNG